MQYANYLFKEVFLDILIKEKEIDLLLLILESYLTILM